MSQDIVLRPLRGRSARGLLAALGALDVATRTLAHASLPTLRWTTSLEPHAVLTGPEDINHLVALCVEDLERWASSPVFTWGPAGVPLTDLKPEAQHALPEWIEVTSQTADRADSDLLVALVADGAVAATKNEAKPTHLHFTAGQQRFLKMANELRAKLLPDHLRAALVGPWQYDPNLPRFGWEGWGEQGHAYRAIAPERDKTPSVPGAEWLALLGLRYLPVAMRRARLQTTGCSRPSRVSSFTWPLWDGSIPSAVVGSLLGRGDLLGMSLSERRVIGVHHLVAAPIYRSEQGRGSFGAPAAVPAGDHRNTEPLEHHE